MTFFRKKEGVVVDHTSSTRERRGRGLDKRGKGDVLCYPGGEGRRCRPSLS